ncbi:uncharacterized protein Adt_22429 [Abeliophyllum distichum]|uniref:Uncharacterized protein n=1 Tax=Abeliophyllum distichum TaxID=126358 RepID=A0ABD1T2N5_9LAMI
MSSTVKHKNKLSKKHLSLPQVFNPALAPPPPPLQLKKKPLRIRNIFKLAAKRKSDASVEYDKYHLPYQAVNLDQMNWFTRSHDTYANFDQTKAQIVLEEREFDFNEESIIPFLVPILVTYSGSTAALQPRKEINLWKRKTMAQHKPLKLNVIN